MPNQINVRQIIIFYVQFSCLLFTKIFHHAKNESYEKGSLVKVSLLLTRNSLIKQKTGQL